MRALAPRALARDGCRDDPAGSVTLLAPVRPGKFVAVGPNYHAHLKGNPPPPRPYYWLKPASAMLDPGGCLIIPDFVPIACHEPAT